MPTPRRSGKGWRTKVMQDGIPLLFRGPHIDGFAWGSQHLSEWLNMKNGQRNTIVMAARAGGVLSKNASRARR